MFHKTHSEIFNTCTVYKAGYTQTQINTQTDRHSDREINRQTDRQTYRVSMLVSDVTMLVKIHIHQMRILTFNIHRTRMRIEALILSVGT